MGGAEKQQWTVRNVPADTVRQVNVLASHYSMTNGEVLYRLVAAAHLQMSAGEEIEALNVIPRPKTI